MSSSRLKVYFRVNAVEVSAFHILSDNSRVAIKIPEYLKRSGGTNPLMKDWLENVEKRIEHYINLDANKEIFPAGERFAWVLRYSVNNPQLDHTKVLYFPK